MEKLIPNTETTTLISPDLKLRALWILL